MIVYRLQRSRFSTSLNSLSQGSIRTRGRWHTEKPVIYTSETTTLAILELLAHYIKLSFIKVDYNLLQIKMPDSISAQTVEEKNLPEEWPREQHLTQKIGNIWFDSMKSCLLKVPSVHTPHEKNIIINTQHPDFNAISEPVSEIYQFDRRFC